MNKFRMRLTELINQTNKTQTQIAKELKISRQKLTNWKSGYVAPDMDDLIKLANYFDVTIDYLVGKTDTY